jgi:endonuclease V-like protein UPF0215 family
MSMSRRISHVIGFDDAPFAREHRGDVTVIGAVYAGTRLEGVLSGKVRRDGRNSTRVLVELVRRSRFRAHLQAVLLQGIAFAGFNVVDIHALSAVLGVPVIVVVRKRPNMAAIRRALLERVPGGARKLKLIERAGPMQVVAGVWVQPVGITVDKVGELIRRLAINGKLPEPLRSAHLIAGGVVTGESRHRA